MSLIPLTPQEVEEALERLPGWEHRDAALRKTFECGDFRAAIAFIVRIAFEAEEMNHHPAITNVYARVSVALQTHDAGGAVTALDLELADRVQKLAPVK